MQLLFRGRGLGISRLNLLIGELGMMLGLGPSGLAEKVLLG